MPTWKSWRESLAATTRRSLPKTAPPTRCTWPTAARTPWSGRRNLLLAQREGNYIDYLDEALHRIADGTFGICRVCGGEIGRPRLEAVPTATQCIACKSKDDKVSGW